MSETKIETRDNWQPLRIALIGTRGVPANYGGFETCVEEIGHRLVEKGHSVTVYCRNSYYSDKRKEYRGMRLIYKKNLKRKALDTLSHTFLSINHAMYEGYDIYMVFNAANSICLFPLKLLRKKIIINTDGLEWKRSKWNFWGKKFYQFSEKLACLLASRLVSDSAGIKSYYKQKHKVDSDEIAYGAYIQKSETPDLIKELGIEPGKYFLQITRFEEENHPLVTIKAYNKLKTDKKLVIIGGNPYKTNYTDEMYTVSQGNDNVLLPGSIYEKELLRELWCNCYAYIHGNSVGGTNPALLQTMASGCFTISVDVPFNRDVLSDCGIYFLPNENSLAQKMEWTLNNEESLEPYILGAQARIKEFYSWDVITEKYENLFLKLHCNRF